MNGTTHQHRTRTGGRIALGLTSAAMVGLLAACGGGGSGGGSGSGTQTPAASAPSTTAPAPAGTTQVKTDLTDFHIALSPQPTQPGRYTFAEKNDGQHDHALEIQGNGTESRSKTVGPGQSTTLTVDLKPGTYQVYCPIDGHKDLGMKTQLTIGGATNSTAPTAPTTTTPGNGNGNGNGTGY
ncbi:plastocyanin/azurin family copper-binding protein [Streptomyces sp. NPDC048659]|uniref:plastocyanin/azurin family copper-binding protein n=1 Tax=Streptomyces sp. NPDC048659 TaxID=3155489 RepID=UPI003424FCA2